MLQWQAVLEESACIHTDAPTRLLPCVFGYMSDTRQCTLDARSMHARCTLMTRIDARLQNTRQNHKCHVIHKKKEKLSFLLFYHNIQKTV